MFNILLDEYPTEFEGYALNTDFRVGIQITQASLDKDLSEYEKLQVFVMLLFKDTGYPNSDKCVEIVEWFLNGWNHDNHKSEQGGKRVMDFDLDQGRIYSAFLAQYRIDLNYEQLHWWKFMYLLTNLEECAFTRVIDIRQKKLTSKMSAEEKGMYERAKDVYAIEVFKSEEDIEAENEVVSDFLTALGKD